MAEVSGKSSKVRYTSVVGTSSTDNASTRSTGAGTNTGYVQINDTGKRHFDITASSTAFKVWRGASQQSATLYDINYVRGIFNWRSGDPSTGTYTIDAVTHTASYLAGGKSWSVDAEVDMLDVTTFSTSTANTQWRRFLPGLSQASASLGRLVSTATGPVFWDRLNLESAFIVELVTDNDNKYEGYAYVSADSYAAPVDDNLTEDVELQITGPLYYSTN
jgi:predicted secreted protein